MKTIGNKQIYENMEEILDPAHTMLVNWDIQNGLVKNIFNKDEFVSNVKKLTATSREHGVAVLYTKITPLPFKYMAPSNIYSYMKRFGVDDPSKLPVFMAPGSEDAEIYRELAPEKDDYVLNKHTASVFTGTNVENMLKGAGITTLVFTGIATEIGVESSVRDAINHGYYTVVASDSCSSHSKEMHEISLKSMSAVTTVMDTGSIINIIKKK
ncbi:isochorismatase [Ferroplasma acidiphilum]|uniref:Isochorismatase n=1 Tax=Ferroplasma acidiphilum TaxID=74969 RepID=E5KBS4_9ARCH|nr:isochorismatase family cysteine hydrolase [Ferroplasma acidiphilum]ADR78327.1 isochorismatase [Ferroplasma acidiphilum]ARD84524.1 isochorismatase [Ferroplasma acidiphilum]